MKAAMRLPGMETPMSFMPHDTKLSTPTCFPETMSEMSSFHSMSGRVIRSASPFPRLARSRVRSASSFVRA